ncbi:MAG: hypothetical protein AAF648_11525 [Pseudomonadota bacterium]
MPDTGTDPELSAVFEDLKTLLKPQLKSLDVVRDAPGDLSLNTKQLDHNGKPVFFSSVKIGKGKVSFHLFPIYCHPELLSDLSPELKKRMQGKSCFNFKVRDPALFKELKSLVTAGAKAFRASGRL